MIDSLLPVLNTILTSRFTKATPMTILLTCITMIELKLLFDEKSMIYNEIINKFHWSIWAILIFFFWFCILDKNTDIKEKIKRGKEEREIAKKKAEEEKVIVEKRESMLKNLTESEKKIISEYIDNKTKTIKIVMNGISTGLEQKGIIFRSSVITRVVSMDGPSFDYNISDLAFDFLNKNPEILNG